MLELSQERNEIAVVSDQKGCPTYAYDLALRTADIIRNTSPYGIYHVTNNGQTTWFDFARTIFNLTKNNHLTVRSITSTEYKSSVVRPKNAVLINSKLPPLRDWQSALEHYLSSLEKPTE